MMSEEQLALAASGYTEYQHLKESGESIEDILQRVETIQRNEQAWMLHFQMINEIRAWNKFKPDALRALLEQEYKNESNYLLIMMASWVNSLRSNVQKNALILYREIITHNQIKLLSSGGLSSLLFKVFEKMDSDYKFLKQEACQAYSELQNQKYATFEPSVIEALTTLSSPMNNLRVQASAYPLLVRYLQDMHWQPFTPLWVAIFGVTVNLAGGKSIECRAAADQLLAWLQGIGQWDAALQYVSQQEPENNVQEGLKRLALTRSKPQSKQQSFRDFRAQIKSKQMVPEPQEGHVTKQSQTQQIEDEI